MDEQEFDSLLPWGRYQRPDMQTAGRLITLGLALWGRTTDDLRQRLLTPTPNVPAGCSLADLQQLERQAEQILGYYLARVSIYPTTLGSLHPQETIAIGTQRFNVLEARCEIARRAVRHLRRRQ
ncbi:MAG TPA: hypothetical protein VNU84_02075 [Candidatus Acidoferrum sp.]|jgi:hypothetical protein|nr:hypothetical protein [Candidatus Acidoferrum sp.]